MIPDPKNYSGWQEWAAAYLESTLLSQQPVELVALPRIAVADLPDPGENEGKIAYAYDAARGNCIVFSDGTNWKSLNTHGAAL
jgi:dipeptidase